MLVFRTLYDYESGRGESYKYLTKHILKVFKFHLNEMPLLRTIEKALLDCQSRRRLKRQTNQDHL